MTRPAALPFRYDLRMITGPSLQLLRTTLLCCAAINYSVLILWVLLVVFPHEWLYRLWGRWFHLTASQFDTINFAGIALYKIAILLLNLVPYLALTIVS